MLLYRSIFHQKQFRYLGAFYFHSLIRQFVEAVFHLFNGIYIFQTLVKFGVASHQAMALTSLTFALMFLGHALTDLPSLWVISRKGLRFSVFWGNIFLIVFYAMLFLAKYDPIFFVLAAIFGGLQLGLYWTAYHIYFVELSDDKRQGEEISFGGTLTALAAIGAPAFGGLMINYGGYEILFLIMAVLLVMAIIPLRYLPSQKDHVPIEILQTIKMLSPKREWKSFLALGGLGITVNTTSVFWPLYSLAYLSGVVGVGFMGSLIGLSATFATLGIGFLIDRFGSRKIINLSSSFDAIIWALRSVVISPIQIFLISILGALSGVGLGIGMDSAIYARARHSGIAAVIVQREIGLSLGISLFMLISGMLLWFGVPLNYLFLIVAATSFLTRLYPEQIKS